MVVVTAYFKFVYWQDFVTPIIGAGMALILVYFRVKIIKVIIAEAN